MKNEKEKIAPLRLGGEMQLKDRTPNSATLEARELFLNLLREIKPEIVRDLTQLFRHDSIPENWKNVQEDLELAVKIFLCHTKNHKYYFMDLAALGFQANVRSTPALALFDYIFRNQAAFDRALKRNGKKYAKNLTMFSQEITTFFALRDLIPDWHELKRKKGSEWLCRELTDWGERWNLTDDWCMDFALECVKNIKTDFADKFSLPENYLTEGSGFMSKWEYERFWRIGKAWLDTLFHFGNARHGDYFFTSEIENYPAFEFVWKTRGENQSGSGFSVEGWYNPLVMSAESFRRKVEEQFLRKFFSYYQYKWIAFIGEIQPWINELRAFRTCVDGHISACHRTLKPYARKTPVKKTGDLHIRWLIESLIPPVKTYTEIASANSVTVPSVSDAVKEIGEVIGITLPERSGAGRPKGAKDKFGPRRRAHKNY